MFARRMKQAMVDLGVSQAELSDSTGIGRSSISQYLSGKNKPGQKHLSAIAEALNVAEAWLTGEIEEETTIGKYSNLPIAVAAKLMNKSKQFVRVGLQQGKLPFVDAKELCEQALKTCSKESNPFQMIEPK